MSNPVREALHEATSPPDFSKPFRNFLDSFQMPQALWLFGLLLCAVQFGFFIDSYRFSADDILFFSLAMRGPDTVFKFGQIAAQDQGRIGALLMIPLNAYAAYFSEYWLFRALVLIIDFGTLALFALWVGRVQKLQIAPLIFVMLIAYHVLDELHLSPAAFPLQNTLPYACLLATRLLILTRPVDTSLLTRIALCGLFGLIMLISEYAFLFGTALIGIEYLIRLFEGEKLRDILRKSNFWLDTTSTVIALVPYLVWRSIYKSTYDGNSMDLSRPLLFLKTWFRHSFELLYVPGRQVNIFRADRWPSDLLYCLIAIILFGLLTNIAFNRTRTRHVESEAPKRLRVLVWLGGIFALYMTVASAGTSMQQDWCTKPGACVYLDARGAYFFSILAFASLLLLLSRKPMLQTATVILVTIGAAHTAFHNARKTEQFAPKAMIWKHAAQLACSEGLIDISEIDPNQLVPVHPTGDPTGFYLGREQFWQLYLSWKKSSCPIGQVRL